MSLPSVTRFAALSLLCAIALALVMGFTLSSLLTRAVSEWESEYTATMVRQEARRLRLDRFFTASPEARALEPWGPQIRGVFESVPEVVRVKVWDRGATVLWSDGLIDLLLTDLVMPEVNGSDLAHELKRRRPAIATIYMSGYSEQTIREQGASPGGVPFLQKPFGRDVLLRRVREVLAAP